VLLLASSAAFSLLAPGLAWLSFIPVLSGLFWLPLRGCGRGAFRYGLGLNRGRGILREAGAGLVGYLAAFPLFFAALMVTVALVRVTGMQPTHPIMDEIGGEGLWKLAKVFALACVFAPVLEEIVFRGALYHYLRGANGALASAVISGLIFAAIHPQGLMGVPMLTTLAFAFAMLREWRGSLVAPMVAHAANNAVAMGLLVLFFGG
jgi:membrane protease YdiL (CAAX protease family)